MTTLCSGAGGFIGGHLVKALLDRGEEVRAVDIRPLDEWKQVHPEAENRRADLSDRWNCESAVDDIDVVYHLAADTGGMEYLASHRAATMLNVLIDTNMVLAARDAAVERFYFASSLAASTPSPGSSPTCPLSSLRTGCGPRTRSQGMACRSCTRSSCSCSPR